jgi:hypothetical protein
VRVKYFRTIHLLITMTLAILLFRSLNAQSRKHFEMFNLERLKINQHSVHWCEHGMLYLVSFKGQCWIHSCAYTFSIR